MKEIKLGKVTAYALAVEQGFEGTLEEWIASLRGKDAPPITDEQVQTAAGAWLDAHPEATTTVQDGSITVKKLAEPIRDTLGKVDNLENEIMGVKYQFRIANGVSLELTDCANLAPKSFTLTGNVISSANDLVPSEFAITINGKSTTISSTLCALSKKDGTVFADVFDAIAKTVTHKVYKLVFTGTETFTYSKYYSNIFTIESTDDYHNAESDYDIKCGALCSHFGLLGYGTLSPDGVYKNGYFGLNLDGSKINFSYCPDGETQATPDQLQAYFKEQYNAGTPVTVYYILRSEKKEKISNAHDIILNAGTNSISNSINAAMDVEYYAEKENNSGGVGTDTSGCVKNTATVDPENPYWTDFKHFMGRNPSISPVDEQMAAPLESAGMITANADRWKTGQEGMSTNGELSESTFAQGGHIFEGWDTEKMWRLTMLIGKFAAGNAHIFTFEPNESGIEKFGVVTIGTDHEWEGLDVSRKYAYMHGNMVAASFSGNTSYGSQKIYGGISGADKTTPAGANIEVTATANSKAPNRVQFNDCTNGIKIPVLGTDPTVLEDGVVWFSSAAGTFKAVVGGEVKTFMMQ